MKKSALILFAATAVALTGGSAASAAGNTWTPHPISHRSTWKSPTPTVDANLAKAAKQGGVVLRKSGTYVPPSSVRTGQSNDIAPALRALHIRGQAMNERYHLGAAAVTAPSSFDWSAFGVGAGAMLGLVLLAGGLTVAGRAARELGRATPSNG